MRSKKEIKLKKIGAFVECRQCGQKIYRTRPKQIKVDYICGHCKIINNKKVYNKRYYANKNK